MLLEQVGFDICIRSGQEDIHEQWVEYQLKLKKKDQNNKDLNESGFQDAEQLQELINIQKSNFTAGVFSTTFQKILELDAQTERYNKDSKKIRDFNTLEFINRKDKELWDKAQMQFDQEEKEEDWASILSSNFYKIQFYL